MPILLRALYVGGRTQTMEQRREQLLTFGIDLCVHLSGERKSAPKSIPHGVDLVLVDTDHNNHPMSMTIQRLARDQKVPIVFVCRSWSETAERLKKRKYLPLEDDDLEAVMKATRATEIEPFRDDIEIKLDPLPALLVGCPERLYRRLRNRLLAYGLDVRWHLYGKSQTVEIPEAVKVVVVNFDFVDAALVDIVTDKARARGIQILRVPQRWADAQKILEAAGFKRLSQVAVADWLNEQDKIAASIIEVLVPPQNKESTVSSPPRLLRDISTVLPLASKPAAASTVPPLPSSTPAHTPTPAIAVKVDMREIRRRVRLLIEEMTNMDEKRVLDLLPTLARDPFALSEDADWQVRRDRSAALRVLGWAYAGALCCCPEVYLEVCEALGVPSLPRQLWPLHKQVSRPVWDRVYFNNLRGGPRTAAAAKRDHPKIWNRIVLRKVENEYELFRAVVRTCEKPWNCRPTVAKNDVNLVLG